MRNFMLSEEATPQVSDILALSSNLATGEFLLATGLLYAKNKAICKPQ